MPSRPYYPKYPSDYLADTAHLSIKAHGVYNLLLDYLWLNNGELEFDYSKLASLLRLKRIQFGSIFDTELAPYFIVKDNKLSHSRVTKEIAKYLDKSEKNRNAARARWDADASPDAMQTHSERYPIPETITINHNKKENNKKKSSPKTPIEKPFELTPEMVKYAEDKGAGDVDDLREHFEIYHTQHGSKFSSWHAAWQNWVRNHLKFSSQDDTPDETVNYI